MSGLTLPWLRLKRLAGLPTATADQEGQLRYQRNSGDVGHLYLAQSTTANAFDWYKLTGESYTVTLGPWFVNDLPATATTPAGLLVFNTPTAVSQTTSTIRAGRTGEIVGMAIVSDAARTAGTATARIALNGVDTPFDGDTVQLNGSTTTQMTVIVAPGNGIALASGANQIGVNVVTSGWGPTTANVAVWVFVRYNRF